MSQAQSTSPKTLIISGHVNTASLPSKHKQNSASVNGGLVQIAKHNESLVKNRGYQTRNMPGLRYGYHGVNHHNFRSESCSVQGMIIQGIHSHISMRLSLLKLYSVFVAYGNTAEIRHGLNSFSEGKSEGRTSNCLPCTKGKPPSLSSGPQQPPNSVFRTMVFSWKRGLKWKTTSCPLTKSTWNLSKEKRVFALDTVK